MKNYRIPFNYTGACKQGGTCKKSMVARIRAEDIAQAIFKVEYVEKLKTICTCAHVRLLLPENVRISKSNVEVIGDLYLQE